MIFTVIKGISHSRYFLKTCFRFLYELACLPPTLSLSLFGSSALKAAGGESPVDCLANSLEHRHTFFSSFYNLPDW